MLFLFLVLLVAAVWVALAAVAAGRRRGESYSGWAWS
jgi:hypothetical protein